MIYLEFVLGFIAILACLFLFAYKRKKPLLEVRYESVPCYIKYVAEQKLDVNKIRGIEAAFWKHAISRTRKVKSASTKGLAKLNTAQQRSVYKIITGSSLPMPHLEYPERTIEETLTIYMKANEHNIKGKALVQQLTK